MKTILKTKDDKEIIRTDLGDWPMDLGSGIVQAYCSHYKIGNEEYCTVADKTKSDQNPQYRIDEENKQLLTHGVEIDYAAD